MDKFEEIAAEVGSFIGVENGFVTMSHATFLAKLAEAGHRGAEKERERIRAGLTPILGLSAGTSE